MRESIDAHLYLLGINVTVKDKRGRHNTVSNG